MTRINRSPAAERDLEELTIAVVNRAAAARAENRLAHRTLGRSPQAWAEAAGYPTCHAYFGRSMDDGPIDQVDIIRIVDGRRDLLNLL